MLQLGAVRTGFVLGLSLVLAAVIYFFAANWDGLERVDKIILSAALVVVFYGLSFVLSKLRVIPAHRGFLSSLLLVGGCIAFGTAAALIGQTYNSHADSWGLFLIWSIPALLLAIITRYQPLYVLTYVLVHLTLWFYFFPSSLHYDHHEWMLVVISGIFLLLNLLLFTAAQLHILASATIKGLSFLLMHTCLLLLTNSFVFETIGPWMNLVYTAALVYGFYYFVKIHLSKMYLTLHALAASAFAIFKFTELALEHASILFFVYGVLFVGLLLLGNWLFFRFLNQLGRDAGDSEPARNAPAEAPVEIEPLEPQPRSDRAASVMGKIFSIFVTVVGVIIGSVSLFGMVFLVSDGEGTNYALLVLALLFIIPTLAFPQLNPTIRYTVLAVSYVIGLVAIAWTGEPLLTGPFLLLGVFGWMRIPGRMERLAIYTIININLSLLLSQTLPFWNFDWLLVVLIQLTLNAAAYFLHFKLAEGAIRQSLRDSALLFVLINGFRLTQAGYMDTSVYLIVNLIYLAALTVLVFVFIRRKHKLDAAVSLIFWFLFLAVKYDDLQWTLLEKSISLALLGILLFAASYLVARRLGVLDASEGHETNLWNQKRLLLAAVIVLQLGYIGYQTASSEVLLRTGTEIKLELEPVDPRSLMQGDYVTLSYTISNPPEAIAEQLNGRRSQSSLTVVLSPDARGVHVFDRLYQDGEDLAAGELLIDGRYSGWGTIYYGIESFFVPEGTGLAVQNTAHFAFVRLSAGGNALLERLAEK